MDEIKKVTENKEIPKTVESTQAAPHRELPHQKSMMEPAEQIERSKDLIAARPELPFPFHQVIDLGNFLEIVDKVGGAAPQGNLVPKVQLAMSQVTLSILDAWSESLHKQAEKQKEVQAILQQADIIKDATVYKENRKDLLQDNDKLDEAAKSSLVLGGLMLAGFAPNFAQLAVTTLAPVAQALQAVSLATGVAAVPLAFTAMVGLVAAGATIQSSLLTLLAKAKGKNAINAAFIEAYTQRILATINNKNLDQTLLNLSRAKEKEAHLLLAQTKLVLLATALVLGYRAETKWMKKEEFFAMVDLENPSIQFREGDARNQLATAFRMILSEIPPKERTELLQKLGDYFDSKPDLDKLLEPNQVAVELFSSHLQPLSPA